MPFTTNFISEERLLLGVSSDGNVLTIPPSANGLVVNIIEGKVRFTLDESDPRGCDGTIVYRGQFINVSTSQNMGSIIQKLRISPFVGKTARIVAYYFD